jgi:serine/threonine-protein kinase SRPK3
MMVFTGERFTAEQLQASNDADLYFDSTCSSSFPPITCIINSVHTSTGTLKSRLPKFRNPFALSLRNYKVLPEPDVLATAAFIERCLRLDPKNRPSAEELLEDEWWKDVV